MNLKIYRDYKNTVDTAFDEGKLEGKLEIAKALKEVGISIDIIVRTTGLSATEISNL